MEERPAETNSHVDRSAPPSVAQLAGRFREQAAAAKETPSSKPTRRKPPCSLPLFPPKVELGQNGEEKSPSNASQLPKIKVKSSPLIEKLQASLTFDPAALLPGASPKSPGLKAMVSPFHSPPSTPSSPGVRSQPSEAEEVPVSFDQPPEGTHLPCYNKVRTRGSIKRRPPSRRFRRSQSDCGELGDFRAVEPAQENGAREEDGDDVFPTKSQAPGSPSPREGTLGEGVGAKLESAENPPGRRTSSSAGEPEQEQQQQQQQQQAAGITAEGTPCKKAEEADQPAAREADPEPPRTASPGAQNGCASPAAEETDPGKEGSAAHEENRPAQKSGDPKTPEEGALGGKTPPHAGGGAEGSSIPEKGPEEQEEGRTVDPGCSQASLETSKEIQTGPNVLMDGTQDEETRM